MLRRQRYSRLVLSILTALLAVFFIVGNNVQLFSRQPSNPHGLTALGQNPIAQEERRHHLHYAPLPPDSRPHLKAGLYMENIESLSMPQKKFLANGLIWLKWDDVIHQYLLDRNLQPDDLFLITNTVDNWDYYLDRINGVVDDLTVDGYHYALFAFAVTSYFYDTDFRPLPFLSLRLPIHLEVPPMLSPVGLPQPLLIYPDNTDPQSVLGSYGSLDGYLLQKIDFDSYTRSSPNGYGTGREVVSSGIRLSMFYRTSYFASAIKYLLPVSIVLLIILLAPSLEGSLADARLSIPMASLLTLIFLQQTYRPEYPTIPFLTLLDWIYAYVYCASIGLFCLFLWGSNVYEKSEPSELEAVSARINRVDLGYQVSFSLGLIFMLLAFWMA